MLNGLKLTPAASPTEFVDLFYDSEALLSTSGCDCTYIPSSRVPTQLSSHRHCYSYDTRCTKGLNTQSSYYVFLETALVGDEM
jgi:hypothetical protein